MCDICKKIDIYRFNFKITLKSLKWPGRTNRTQPLLSYQTVARRTEITSENKTKINLK